MTEVCGGWGSEVFVTDDCGGWGRNGFVTEDSCICNSARLGIGGGNGGMDSIESFRPPSERLPERAGEGGGEKSASGGEDGLGGLYSLR